MRIDISEEKVGRLLPFTGPLSEEAFEQMEGSFESVMSDLVAMVLNGDESAMSEDLQGYAEQWVVFETMLGRLHSHDLVMTDSGFGVVSTQNIAPASRDRVEAMERELEWRRDQALEQLLLACRNDLWADTRSARENIPTLLWRPTELKRYAFNATLNKRTGRVERATFAHVNSCMGKIMKVQTQFEREYSPALLEALLREERSGSERTKWRQKVVELLKVAMGQEISGSNNTELTFQQIGRTIAQHIGDFGEYADSDECQSHRTGGYENTLQQKAYFF